MHATRALNSTTSSHARRSSSPLAWLAAALVAALAPSTGCSSSSGSATQPTADAAPEAAAPCSEPNDDPAATCIRTVSGKVTDVDGNPIAGKTISVCGIACYYAHTEADGSFVANIGANLVAADYAVLAHGRPEYASLYAKLPSTGAENLAISTMKMPKYTQGTMTIPADGAAASTLTAGDLTLDVPADTKFNIDAEDVVPGGRPKFQLGQAKATELPDFAAGTGAVALYGLAPFGATTVQMGSSGPAAKTVKMAVHLKNSFGLAAGAKVQFFVLGVNLLSTPPSAGSALNVAKGTVSADGKTIDTDAGEGISILSWLGVKPL